MAARFISAGASGARVGLMVKGPIRKGDPISATHDGFLYQSSTGTEPIIAEALDDQLQGQHTEVTAFMKMCNAVARAMERLITE